MTKDRNFDEEPPKLTAKGETFLRQANIPGTIEYSYTQTALGNAIDFRHRTGGPSGETVDLSSPSTQATICTDAINQMADDLDGFTSQLRDEGLLTEEFIGYGDYGRDFYMTRNEHETGFTDGSWDFMGPKWADRVYEIAVDFDPFFLAIYDDSGTVFAAS